MEIPLKLKYRTATKGRYKSGYGGNNNPARPHRPLTEKEKELHMRQPKKVMHMLPSGKTRMVIAK